MSTAKSNYRHCSLGECSHPQRLRGTGDTAAQVAETVGYESESTFSRAFRREMGVAPGMWRKNGGALAADLPL